MGEYRSQEVNTCVVADCVPIQAGDDHWFAHHMPCWICGIDPHEKRGEIMWNDDHTTYFHRSCLEAQGRG